MHVCSGRQHRQRKLQSLCIISFICWYLFDAQYLALIYFHLKLQFRAWGSFMILNNPCGFYKGEMMWVNICSRWCLMWASKFDDIRVTDSDKQSVKCLGDHVYPGLSAGHKTQIILRWDPPPSPLKVCFAVIPTNFVSSFCQFRQKNAQNLHSKYLTLFIKGCLELCSGRAGKEVRIIILSN